MSIFGKKKEKEVPAAAKTSTPVVRKTKESAGESTLPTLAFWSPRITEKGTLLVEKHTYVFNVAPDSDSRTIARAVEALYKVKPVAVRVVAIPGKRMWVRGKMGKTARGKKAYVTLKKGEVIDFA